MKTLLTNSIGLSYAVGVAMGFGAGLVMVSTFARVYKEAMLQNYSDDIRTYLVISGNKVDYLYILWKTFLKVYFCPAGVWNSSYYFGAFAGPSISGFVVESIGFSSASFIFVPVLSGMLIANVVELIYNIQQRHNKIPYFQLI
jgi:hypothetical protein